MILVLDVIKSGKNRPLQKSFRFEKSGGVIGRSEEADYQLSDPHNYISGKHVHIQFDGESYSILDTSTNGTFLKHPYQKLPKGVAFNVSPSDIFIIGDHELQARLDEQSYSNDFIIGHQTPLPEPLAAIEELIPDDDFLLDDEPSILLGESKTTQKTVDVIELFEPKALRLEENEEDVIPSARVQTFHDTIRVPKAEFSSETLIAILEKRLNFDLKQMDIEAQTKLFEDMAEIVFNATQSISTLYSLQKNILQHVHDNTI